MGATISSYTWLCMIINFLQTRNPPVLPVLHQIPHLMRRNSSGVKSTFADDLPVLRGFGQPNKETLGQLLFQFFRFYGYEIDYEKFVVSVRQGKLLTREAKGWPIERRLCVEEPFNTYRNLGNSADDYSFHGIHEEIRRAFDLLADGLKLDQCLEQYEFPPLEKATFKKPEPKPKPVLSRSHSQTRRSSTNNAAPGNLSIKGKQQFSQRNGPAGRRSSSGAAFGQPRYPYPQSPPVGVHGNDYFEPANLHNQLLQQYQVLHNYENILKAQMAQAQVQSMHGPASDSRGVGSPTQRSVTSNPAHPRRGTVGEAAQHGALLPGFLYHFPVNYPRPQMHPQNPQRDGSGTNTNPSSPSLMAAVPALNRVHRSSAHDGSAAAAVRSQSQPGRSAPNPISVHAIAHPGFDVSGAIGHPMARPLPGVSPQGQNGVVGRYTQVPTLSGPSVDPGMAKEYVGYYVGESPQLMPQYSVASMANVPPYTDVPTRRRRVSPDLAPPDGLRRTSRSPSPLGRSRTYSNGLRSAPLPGYIPPRHIPLDMNEPGQDEPPPIANGSFPVTPLASSSHSLDSRDSGPPTTSNRNPTYPPKIPEFGDFGQSTLLPAASLYHDRQEAQSSTNSQVPHAANGLDIRSRPYGIVDQTFQPTSEPMQQMIHGQEGTDRSVSHHEDVGEPLVIVGPRQVLENDDGQTSRTVLDSARESRPLPVPHLSPVFETQSPSPIISRRLESSAGTKPTGPKSNAEGSLKENQIPQQDFSRPAEQNLPQSNSKEATIVSSSAQKLPVIANGHTNGWQQQKTKKAGRRRANSYEEGGRSGIGKEPLPANEADRKGG